MMYSRPMGREVLLCCMEKQKRRKGKLEEWNDKIHIFSDCTNLTKLPSPGHPRPSEFSIPKIVRPPLKFTSPSELYQSFPMLH